MATVQDVQGWHGRTLVDADGDKIGKIEDIYLDRQSGDPEWVAVKTGLFGTRVSFVPIRDATATGDDVRVAHPKDKVKDAPNIEADGELSPDEERALYEHYGREDYGDWTDDSEDRSERTVGPQARGGDGDRTAGEAGTIGEPGTTGERGTTGDAGTTGERGTTGDAGTTGEHGTAGEAGTAAAATAGMAAAGTAGTESRGTRDTEGGTGTAAGTTGTGTAGTAGDDREAEGYGREGVSGEGVTDTGREGVSGEGVTGTGREGVAGDTAAGTAGEDAMTRSEEELAVGTQRRETGRARLRKYVVTEDVTERVPVQREELRVEREPITDDNIEQATQGPDISEAEHEITLHAEEPVAEKQAVPKERVRLDKDVQSDEQTVSDQVRKERIEPEGDAR
jgi:uncharacterized protein (TIGR02271 family)